MDQEKRVDRIEAKVKGRIKDFWDQFSDDELKAISDGDPNAIARCKQLGADEVIALQKALATPQERAELEQIEKRVASARRLIPTESTIYVTM